MKRVLREAFCVSIVLSTVPRSLQEFCSIVEHRSAEDSITAVERIYTCNHPSISPSNKDQLQVRTCVCAYLVCSPSNSSLCLYVQAFLGILMDYCMKLGSDLPPKGLLTLDKLVR